MKRITTTYVVLFCLTWLSFVSIHQANASPPETHIPIVIITNHRTSQIVMSKITGRIFTHMGYHVSYHQSPIEKQWGAIARGKYHVQVEIREDTMKVIYDFMIINGGIISAGTHDATSREEWWIKKGVWPGMPIQWPCAYKTLKNINFTNAMISHLSLMVDVEHFTHDEAAERWLIDNEALWQSWIPDECAE